MLILTFPGMQSWNRVKEGLGCTIWVRSSTLGKTAQYLPERKKGTDSWTDGDKKNCYCRWAHQHPLSQPKALPPFSQCFTQRPPYLSMKEGSLFCTYEIHWTGMFLGVFGKLWTRTGAWPWIPWRLDLRCKSSWILNDFFTENEMKWN